LNLPAQPLLQLLRRSPTLTESTKLPPTPLKALHWSRGADSMKLYIYYEDAWWINALNRTYGYFNNTYKPACVTSGASVPQFAPLTGRYHDGDVRCSGNNNCRGMLEAVYGYDVISIAFYRPYLADAKVPYRLLNYTESWEARELLDAVHASLVAIHESELASRGDLQRVAALRPSQAALAIWDRMAEGFGAGIHDWMRDDSAAAACHSFTECQAVMPAQVLQPLGANNPVFVVNEAFGSRVGWCEDSLAMAENVVHSHYGLQRPSWITATDYDHWVIFHQNTTAALHKHTLSAARP